MKNEGGLGGTVNIVTRQPDAGWHATANLAAGSAGYLNPAASVSFGGETVSALAGFSWRSSDAYVDGSGKRFTELTNYKPSEVDSAAFKVGTAWGKLRVAPLAGHAAEVAWTHQEANQVFYPYLKMDSPWDRSDRLSLAYDIAGGGSAVSAVKLLGYYTQVDHFMTDQFRTSAGTAPLGYSMGTLANSRTLGGKLQATLFSEVTAGVEAFHRFWETIGQMSMMGSYMSSYGLPGATADIAGLYADWKHPLSGQAELRRGSPGRLGVRRSRSREGQHESLLRLQRHALDVVRGRPSRRAPSGSCSSPPKGPRSRAGSEPRCASRSRASSTTP